MKEALALGFNPVITLFYDTAPAGVTGDIWQAGVQHCYENITALIKIVSPYSMMEEKFGNIAAGKTIFYINYDLKYDFRNKKNFIAVFDGRRYNIDRIIPDILLSDQTYLYYCLIEK